MTSVWRSSPAATSVTTASRPSAHAPQLVHTYASLVSEGMPATTGTARAPSTLGPGVAHSLGVACEVPATSLVSQLGPLITARRGRYPVNVRRQDCGERWHAA